MFAALSTFLSVSYCQLASHYARLDSIRAAIRSSHANWRAGINPIFLLPRRDFLRLLGAQPPDTVSYPRWDVWREVKGPLELPDSFDWRNKDGRNWMTHVTSQGCGDCWVHATVGAWEADINIATDSAEYDPDLSEQQVLSCSGIGSCSGGNFAGYYLQSTGLFDEDCFPYLGTDEPCESRCSDWQDRILFRALSTQWVSSSAIKALVYQQPTYTVMDVYEDFPSYTGGVYEHVWGDYCGGHAVVIVGWNDADSCWICKNSWGTGWGENGYFRIKYGECGVGSTGYRIIVGSRLWVRSPVERVYPSVGYSFHGVDSVVVAFAETPVMGAADTVFACAGAQLYGFKRDSSFSADSISFVMDGPSQLVWLWDTLTGIPKVDVFLQSSHEGARVMFEYMELCADTSVQWMAESTATISTDTHQTLLTSPTRQAAVSFDHWSDGGARTHQVTLSSAGADTFKAFFNEDTVRYLVVINSNSWGRLVLDDSVSISPPYSEFMDSATSHFVFAPDCESGNQIEVFDHWEPPSAGRTIYFDVDSACTLFAHYKKRFRLYFNTSFGFGLVRLNGVLWDAARLEVSDSGVAVLLGIADSQLALGHTYVFKSWSDGVDTAHYVLLDTLWRELTALYDVMSRVSVSSPFGTPTFEDSIAFPDSEITVSVESVVYAGEVRHRCMGWRRVWEEFDTLLFACFDRSFEPFPPAGWSVNGGYIYVRRNEWQPFCMPQQGESFCEFAVGWMDTSDTCSLISDTFFVPPDADSAKLWFWMFRSPGGSCDDSLFLLISTDYGATWDTLSRLGRMFDSLFWEQQEIDLSGYSGDSVMVGFLARAGGFSESVFMLDNVIAWAAFSRADSGEGSTASFVPSWNCSLEFLWRDEYHLVVESPHGSPTGEGWYPTGSLAVLEVEDSVFDGGYCYVFRRWSGAVDTALNPCTLSVSAPGTVWARWDTLVWATVASDPPGAELLVDSVAANPWEDWLRIGDSVWVEASSLCALGADSQLAFQSWSDGGERSHWATFPAPDTLWANYLWLFRCAVVQDPIDAPGWVALDADTAEDSASAWIYADSFFLVDAADTAFDFEGMTTWVFSGFSDGFDTAHAVGPVAEPVKLYANYLAEEMFINIAVAGSVWIVGDTACAGDTLVSESGEEFVVLNLGNAPVDIGIRFVRASDTLWQPDTVQWCSRFVLRARFDDAPPSVFDPICDLVDTAFVWSDSLRFGPLGWNVSPQDSVRLWLWLALPIYYTGGGERWLQLGIEGRISIP